jgi:hypothetical protein
MLDRLPPWLRHLVVLCGLAPAACAVGTTAQTVIAAGGVTTVDWPVTGIASIDAAGAALAVGATTWLALVVTPLTRQYGVGSRSTS